MMYVLCWLMMMILTFYALRMMMILTFYALRMMMILTFYALRMMKFLVPEFLYLHFLGFILDFWNKIAKKNLFFIKKKKVFYCDFGQKYWLNCTLGTISGLEDEKTEKLRSFSSFEILDHDKTYNFFETNGNVGRENTKKCNSFLVFSSEEEANSFLRLNIQNIFWVLFKNGSQGLMTLNQIDGLYDAQKYILVEGKNLSYVRDDYNLIITEDEENGWYKIIFNN